MVAKERQQQTRSLVTRERLISAALDEIFDKGLPATTTQDIARRAEVSRGALLHHFPTREALVVACMEASLEDGTRQIHDMATQVRQGRISLDDFLDFLWRLFSGRFFYVALEMTSAARNDPTLSEPMIPVVHRFHEALDSIWAELCTASNREAGESSVILNMTLCLFRGMGVQSILRTDLSYYADLLRAWKVLLPDLLRGRSGELVFAAADGAPRSPASPQGEPSLGLCP